MKSEIVIEFLNGLKALITNSPELILSQDLANNPETTPETVIGKWTDKGLFIIPEAALSELVNRRETFNQELTVDNLTRELHAMGLLIVKDGEHKKVQVRMNGEKKRGWLLSPEAYPLPSPFAGDSTAITGDGNIKDVEHTEPITKTVRLSGPRPAGSAGYACLLVISPEIRKAAGIQSRDKVELICARPGEIIIKQLEEHKPVQQLEPSIPLRGVESMPPAPFGFEPHKAQEQQKRI